MKNKIMVVRFALVTVLVVAQSNQYRYQAVDRCANGSDKIRHGKG